MFICDKCGKPSQPGEKCNKIVAQQKEFFHPFRGYAHKKKNLMTMRTEYTPDEGGKGLQTVKELKICAKCREQVEAQVESKKNENASS